MKGGLLPTPSKGPLKFVRGRKRKTGGEDSSNSDSEPPSKMARLNNEPSGSSVPVCSSCSLC